LDCNYFCLLLGADLITADRIAANQEFEVLSTILDAYDESYTTANINDVFEDKVDTITVDDLTFYVHKTLVLLVSYLKVAVFGVQSSVS
jgi:hypothetical protein